MTVGEQKRSFILGLANEALFAPTRTKTMKALQSIGQRMTPEQIERFPKTVALFAPETETKAGLIACPAREHALLFLSPDLEEQPESVIRELLAIEFARLVVQGVPENNDGFDSPDQANEVADLIAIWTEEEQERTAGAA